jgi:trehalose synthase
MADGVGGILVDSVEECAEAITRLLQDPEQARELGQRGRDRVREHFLLPRLLLDEVSLMLELARKRPLECRLSGEGARHDPVCRMAVSEDQSAPAATYRDREYRFCSEDCRRRFLTAPERYVGDA